MFFRKKEEQKDEWPFPYMLEVYWEGCEFKRFGLSEICKEKFCESVQRCYEDNRMIGIFYFEHGAVRLDKALYFYLKEM